LENHSLQIDATAAESAMHGILKLNSNRTSTLFEAEHDFSNQVPDTSLLDNGGGDGDIPSAEWPLSLPVQLPESFDFASQSISTSIIRISHELVIQAHFQNTESDTPMVVSVYSFKNPLAIELEIDQFPTDPGTNSFLDLHDTRSHWRRWNNPWPRS
jgi:hypothetical protein